jgi:MoaA/NifB/PqqE/SkfB family radical SAM enzyme
MTPNFDKYIIYAKQIGIPFVSLCSNMMLINEEIIRCLVDKKIDEVILSINGYSDENYHRIMKKSNFHTVMNNLKKLTDYKRRINSKYPKIRINTILMKSNVLEFDKLLEIVDEHEIDLIRFIPLRKHTFPNDPDESEKEEISNIEANVLTDLVNNIDKKINELKLRGISVTIPTSFLNRKLNRKNKVNNSCCFPFYNYRIRHDGAIESCIRDSRGKIGNFYSDDFRDIMKNRDVFRKMALEGNCNISVCATNTEIPDII